MPQQKQKQEGNCSRSRAEDGGGIVGGSRPDRHLAGEHDLAHLALGDALCGRFDGRFEVAGRTHTANPGTVGQVGVEHRQGIGGAQAGQPRADPIGLRGCVVAGRNDQVDRQKALVAGPADRQLRQDQRGGRKR